MEKLHSYQGWIGRFHEWQESFRERFRNWRQEHPETVIELLKNKVYNESSAHGDGDYSHIYRSFNNLCKLSQQFSSVWLNFISI